ncbi:GspE/PulE family protein [Rubeoparvulum massiliense]|uniref:GspE/PulE family protein n=1 Tax=Rubeoparvulum massiliense TaxID=1631346 RepID=UPI00065E1267|nr:ATPase, T2SS/T4P/T4SS family [Rubeoparvulum massiliense]
MKGEMDGVITERKRLGDLLVETGLISEEQLQQTLASKKPNQRLGDALLEQGFITELQLIEALEFQLGIPHVSLYRYPFDTNLFTLISKEEAKRNLLIPLKRNGNKLIVAMADPLDYIAMDDLRMATGFEIDPVIATKYDILRAINSYYGSDQTVEEWLSYSQAPEETEAFNTEEEETPVIRLVNQLLQHAVELQASDIHIDPQESQVLVRYRVDGVLRTERTLPKHMQNVLIARIKVMGEMDITESRLPQDGRIKVDLDFHPIDLRISTLPTVYGEKVVLRVLDLGNALNELSKLELNKLNLKRYMNLIQRPTGIILITGPTGSGKTSTLYATLNYLNDEAVNIITVEDPVEYQIEGINQVQVNGKVGLTFARGLRSILRQDPNIVMVGEIRDLETAEIAIRASLTGHLVLSTLHTNDSVSTIIRLVDMGIEPFLVAASVSGVMSQRLVRRVCRDCKTKRPPEQWEKELFTKHGLELDEVIYGKGCGTCNMTGYKGRIALQEILILDDQMKQMIMEKASLFEIRQYAKDQGTIFLLEDGLRKVSEGLTTLDEVLRVTIDE